MQRSPTCPNCCHNFGTQDPSRPHGPRLPLLLQCGHTLCEGCITKLGKQRKSIHCPKCDSVTVVGEHGIFPDIYVLGLLSLNRKLSMDGAELAMIGRIGFTASKNGVRKKKKFKKREQSAAAEGVSPDDMCDECGKKAATAHCIKCECNMCGVCFDKVHHASKILMKHQAFPLNKVTGTVPLICPEHDDKKIDLYCDDCEKAICTHCVLFGEHKPHNYMSLEEKNKEVAVNIEPAVQVAMDTIEKLKSADK
ncbi:E3 ubiquitin-protein ligase Midline-1-like, partial [Saccoglossus kowalevskii]|uniref:E3 ubiquitin-protein ligase TRIM36-like n=1 Tax=Saccoglossus kowalevskii TaxID=10224 RepID=A0ABM0M0Y1_SACKO